MGILEKEENKEQNIWNNSDWEFPPRYVRQQTTDPGNSIENTKWNKMQ